MEDEVSTQHTGVQQPILKVKLGRPRKGTRAPTACLSEDEKKGRRRAANRESARRMRARRVETVQQLTAKVQQLQNRCAELQNCNQAMRQSWKKVAADYRSLQAQLAALTGVPTVGDSPTLPPMPNIPMNSGASSATQTSTTDDDDLMSCLETSVVPTCPPTKATSDPAAAPSQQHAGASISSSSPDTPPVADMQMLLADSMDDMPPLSQPSHTTLPPPPNSELPARCRPAAPTLSASMSLKPPTSRLTYPTSIAFPPHPRDLAPLNIDTLHRLEDMLTSSRVVPPKPSSNPSVWQSSAPMLPTSLHTSNAPSLATHPSTNLFLQLPTTSDLPSTSTTPSSLFSPPGLPPELLAPACGPRLTSAQLNLASHLALFNNDIANELAFLTPDNPLGLNNPSLVQPNPSFHDLPSNGPTPQALLSPSMLEMSNTWNMQSSAPLQQVPQLHDGSGMALSADQRELLSAQMSLAHAGTAVDLHGSQALQYLPSLKSRLTGAGSSSANSQGCSMFFG